MGDARLNQLAGMGDVSIFKLNISVPRQNLGANQAHARWPNLISRTFSVCISFLSG